MGSRNETFADGPCADCGRDAVLGSDDLCRRCRQAEARREERCNHDMPARDCAICSEGF